MNIGKTGLLERRVSDISRVVLHQRTVSEIQSSEGGTGLAEPESF